MRIRDIVHDSSKSDRKCVESEKLFKYDTNFFNNVYKTEYLFILLKQLAL